ncbi:GTP-binding protein TrmE N-terminus-domain-containing protein [Lipomyces japonicus]|uniref:GTP-binding protein TrmE N-terminus-domain-containing protein n=1 Tax=Lipomyces japonicus TaxID=56871 RepID=UPI0034CF8B18
MRGMQMIFRRWSSNSTIYALSTAQGRAALAVIRLSGPRTTQILQRMTRNAQLPPARMASRRRLFAPKVSITGISTEILDDALAIYFPAPNSYTGEDVVELHVHGGRAVINAVMSAITMYGRDYHDDCEREQTGDVTAAVRYAEPGEFTRRAFDNFKLDLTEVEGIGGMIDAETESQRVAAINSAGGYLRKLYDSWRHELLQISGLMSAIIDFSEEAYLDEPDNLFGDTVATTSKLLQSIRQHVLQIQRSEILLQGVKLALLGPPNAGKSSLLNLLARRDAAIVSNIPGTTRDIIEIGLELGGYKVVLTDTAGLRSVHVVDEIEAQGIMRAKSKSAQADVVIAVLPVVSEDSSWEKVVRDEILGLQNQADDNEIEYATKDDAKTKTIVVVLNKVDQLSSPMQQIPEAKARICKSFGVPESNIFAISCLENEGIAELTRFLVGRFTELTKLGDDEASSPIGASVRVQEILQHDVVPSLERFLEHAEQEDVVFASEEIRHAAAAIGRITGQTIGVEEILGVVFSKFCVGK